MTLGFSDGAYNLASGTRDAFGALSDDLVREGHPPMVSRSGDREPADQLRIWYERMTLTPGNRRVYGRKWWQGRLWYQIHPDAVGIPDTSNHEKRRSNDLRAPYNADTTAARRAKELAKRHNITREGEKFRELWHWTFWGPLGTIGAPAPAGGANTAPVPEEGIEMLTIKWGDHIFTCDRSYLKHETNNRQASTMGWLLNRNDRMAKGSMYVGVDNDAVNALQKSLSIPWYAFELVMSGRGFNIEGTRGDGTGESGRVWSLQHEINAKLDGIRLDTTGLAKSFDELLEKI